MKLHFNISVKGLVHGVWFRKYTCEEAIKLNLKGFVRNEIDGSVYVEAEGEETDLIQLLQFLKQGSPLSKVSAVNHKIAPLKIFEAFKISR